MNTANLIKLGAYAQKIYDMKEDFKVMIVPSDTPNIVRVAISIRETEDIKLQTFGSTDNFETITIGYARAANVLVVKDAG
ncbi:MAG: hypothetical protein J0M11_03715 [Anaerolineae bacterium]|nr:hypothetical protein [Anaerolineae bacterium]